MRVEASYFANGDELFISRKRERTDGERQLGERRTEWMVIDGKVRADQLMVDATGKPLRIWFCDARERLLGGHDEALADVAARCLGIDRADVLRRLQIIRDRLRGRDGKNAHAGRYA